MWKIVVLWVSCLVSVCYGHMCLVTPPQRGPSNNINAVGAGDCYLKTGPCGGRPQNLTTGTALVAGKLFTVTIQKNLDHFNSATPGYFAVSIGADEASLKEIHRIPDTSEPSLALYSDDVTVPSITGQMIVQIKYVTNNDPPFFFQCSDVLIVPSRDFVPVG